MLSFLVVRYARKSSGEGACSTGLVGYVFASLVRVAVGDTCYVVGVSWWALLLVCAFLAFLPWFLFTPERVTTASW